MNLTLSTTCPGLKEKYLKWPATAAGQFAQVPCIAYLNGVFYDTTKNAYKYCRPNGTWSPKKNLSMCYPLKNKTLENLRGAYSPFDSTSILIYYIGYTLSIMFLTIALFILLRLKTLRCMRNIIHCHLIMAFILSDFSFIIFHLLFSNKYSVSYELQAVVPHRLSGCNAISIVYTYFYTSNFFWMFAEGIFMYQMVIVGFTHKILALRYIVLIGWGSPLLTTFAWVMVTYKSHGDICLIQRVNNRNDQIYLIPILIVLIINFIILALVLKLLVEKVYSSKAGGDINYLKSFKGFLFLIPHLGIIYLITLYQPATSTNDTFRKFIIPLLVSTQGFFVSLYCCFMNKEVRFAILAEMKNMENRRKSSCTSSYLLPTSSTDVSNLPFLKRFSLASSTSNSGGRNCKKRSSIEEEEGAGGPEPEGCSAEERVGDRATDHDQSTTTIYGVAKGDPAETTFVADGPTIPDYTSSGSATGSPDKASPFSLDLGERGLEFGFRAGKGAELDLEGVAFIDSQMSELPYA